MYGIKIQDSRKTVAGGNFLNFDLRDILAVIGEPARQYRWRGRNIWCTASRDGKPFAIREERRDFSGEEFLQFVSSVHQTIDGSFEVRREGAAKKSWLKIVAFDSAWFEVWSSKLEVIEKLRNHFEEVSGIA